MRIRNTITIVITALTLGMGLISCDKYVDRDGTELGLLVPAKTDVEAAAWKPYTLTTPQEITVAAPEAVTSASYLAELAEVKAEVAKIDDNRRDAIRYWGSGGVVRWNQIMREMVAKNNLAPPEVNGAYPAPNAADADNMNGTGTGFPFSNPPYAARAYAYVSVAQYDALVAAMAWKKQYARKTPNAVDASITPIILAAPKLSSYPSEDAVMAAVSYEFMKRLFPKTEDTLYLYKKKEQQKWYKLWAGVSTRSDIEAGEKLGKAIFTKVFNRFRVDGMAQALGTQAKWDSLAARTQDRDVVAWKSMENAPRPPMLPFYGNVQPWNMDKATLVAVSKSLKPYASTSAEFKKDLAEVKSYTDNPTRENIAIVHFWADGTGTHTPPGHWNQIAEKYIVAAKQSEVRTARNYALLNTAMMDAAISCWYTKSYYYYPRPSQMDGSIKTLTGLPNFPSYTSGHSTFSASACVVLGYLFPTDAQIFVDYAKEASMSRLYGGIHYRMDCDGGMKIGESVGGMAVTRGKGDGVQ